MYVIGIDITRKQLILTLAVLVLSTYYFFNSSSIGGLLEKSLFVTSVFFLVSMVWVNFDSRIKISGLILMILISSGAFAFFQFAGPIVCDSSYAVSYHMAHNPVTDDVVHKKVAGSGDHRCRDESFPWYYEEASRSEIERFCSENPSKGYCKNNPGILKEKNITWVKNGLMPNQEEFLYSKIKNTGEESYRLSSEDLTLLVDGEEIDFSFGLFRREKEASLGPNESLWINTTVKRNLKMKGKSVILVGDGVYLPLQRSIGPG